MTLSDWINLAAIVIGPIVAVLITLWIEGRRRDRDQKLTLLRLLISTRHLPSDPNFQIAINLIPIEFPNHPRVSSAYKEFIEAARVNPVAGNEQQVSQNTAAKTARLVYEIAKCLGFEVHETDIQYAGYSSQGWTERDRLLLDSQRAMRDVANILIMQSRIMSDAPLNQHEKNLLGLAALEDKNAKKD